jgi:hypothetical protein
MSINEYMAQFPRNHNKRFCPEVHCTDGFTMSVQAGEKYYCSPRSYTGPYTTVEVGYPSEPEEVLTPYDNAGVSVYGWVPVEIVDAIIAKHGGFAK